MMRTFVCFIVCVWQVSAFHVSVVKKGQSISERRAIPLSPYADTGRRSLFKSALVVASPFLLVQPEIAEASGGATAGKYTTIPIAKRRYYGRVQEAVHEFLEMGPDVVKGDMTAPAIQNFFDIKATVIVTGGSNMSINGQCTRKDGNCKGAEIRDSRWNDMKASMYLLGNAFRLNQQKPPDLLPTVKSAKAFFKEINAMEKLVVKSPKKNDVVAQQYYIKALDILDTYLDLVELPPTESGHYDKRFSTKVGDSARIT